MTEHSNSRREDRSRKPTATRWGRQAVKIMMVLFAVFAAGELLCQVFVRHSFIDVPPPARINPNEGNPYMLYRRPFIYSHLPNARYIQKHPYYQVDYVFNSRGFRGADVPSQPPEGVKRLLVIGDSLVEGHGSPLAQCFAGLLKKQLAPANWEVINCGIQGTSPLVWAASYARYADMHPDAVLMVVFDNDLYEDRFYERRYFTLPFTAYPEAFVTGSAPPAIYHFKSFIVIRQAINMLTRPYEDPALVEMIKAHRSQAAPNAEQQALDKLSKYLVAPSLFDGQWQQTRRYLDYLVTRWRRAGVTVLVCNLSLKNIDPASAPAFQRHARMLDERIGRWAAENAIMHRSLVPAMRTLFRRYGRKQMIIPEDGHPTALGHSLIAGLLAPWLKGALGIDTPSSRTHGPDDGGRR